MDFRVMASKAAPDDNRVSEEAEDLPNNCASETESRSQTRNCPSCLCCLWCCYSCASDPFRGELDCLSIKPHEQE